MPISKTLYVTNRDEWRDWLKNHHASEREVWLIYHKKDSGQPRIPYDDAVEEALCFGWIDSLVKRIDDQKFAQKFTPRKNHTKWSASNKRRVRKLIREKRMTKVGLAKIDPAILEEKSETEQKQNMGNSALPQIFKRALNASPKAREYFEKLAPSYRRLYIAWVMAGKKEETRQRRLREAVSLLEQNKKLGLK
jgi:uncharacterized protein YdeI (YjbR/CyaY-like superfamily)